MRMIVLFLAASSGFLISFFLALLLIQFGPLQPQVNAGVQKVAIAEICIVLFVTTYWAARGLYWLFGRPSEAAEVRATQSEHVPLLHLSGGLLMLITHLTSLFEKRGVAILDGVFVVIGLALIVDGALFLKTYFQRRIKEREVVK